MVFISIERYYILKSAMNIKNLNKKILLIAVCICLVCGLFWSLMPLLGWSHYTLEDSYISCSVEWKEQTFNVISYNICIFTFVFAFPFGLAIFVNIKSILIVNNFFFLF